MKHVRENRSTGARRALIHVSLLIPLGLLFGCDQLEKLLEEVGDSQDVSTITVPAGFAVEKVATGLTYPTSLTWDDHGTMYVAEAGGGLNPEQLAPSRILKVTSGKIEEVANVSDQGVMASLVGLTWYDGDFYITHRAEDLTGAVSRVSRDGQVTQLFKGIIDSQSEHQINDIRVGPDGLMYVAVGPAGNSGVMDLSVAPWIMVSPDVRTTPCQDIVLLGKNFKTPDFRTDDPDDSVMTGAYVPFGTETAPGEVIQGVSLCGGSILQFSPSDPMGSIRPYAWGFRNLIGIAWDPQTGAMYGAENGYDVRGSRPVKDETDVSLKITEGTWYGVPDYSAGREPLTDSKFDAPDSLQAGIFIGGEPVGKDLGFLIDHQKSGLTPPNPSVVLGRHEFNSSPSLLDVAPASWDELAGQVFIAEWGDLAPPTNPLRGKTSSGFQVVQVDPATGDLTTFVGNRGGGPASAMGQEGKGLERPFDVKFGPDGAMYIVDYGVVTIDTSLQPPYAYKPGTGAVWKVTKQ